MGEALKLMFKAHGGVMRTAELQREGLYYRKVQSLLAEGRLEQLRRGYYRYVDENSFSDLPILKALFPDAVICMESALDYYGYTDRTPAYWHLAVSNRTARKRFQIEYPLVKPHFIQEDRYSAGIEEAEIDGCTVKIYDKERTICDLIANRKKIDAEIFTSALRNYMQSNDKKIETLYEYAEKMGIEEKVKEIVEVLYG